MGNWTIKGFDIHKIGYINYIMVYINYFVDYMINVFGSETAEKVLLYIQNYGRGNSNEIANTFGVSQSMVWKQLIKFEREGVFASTLAGRTRVFEINPRYAFRVELSALLEKAIDRMPDKQRQEWFMQRRRPRRFGKPL